MRLARQGLFFLVIASCVVGGAIIILDSLWMTYGVFMRYVIRNPDRAVTEATGLLLVPLAYAGLPLAMRDRSFPRVTFVLDALSGPWRARIEKVNLIIMVLVSAFFLVVSGSAALRTFHSGASSYVLNWPEYPFWLPVTYSIGVLTLLAIFRLFTTSSELSNGSASYTVH